jgi:hypothetical protein
VSRDDIGEKVEIIIHLKDNVVHSLSETSDYMAILCDAELSKRF